MIAPLLINGNNLDVLRHWPLNYFDSIVTDPPYGLSFMGKKWDSFVPGPKVWEQIMRVLKPGGHVFSFSGCYDRDTEALTTEGWKSFADVTMEDEFASLNIETEEIAYQSPKGIVRRSGHKKMYRWSTNKIDLLVTPNHNCLIKNMGGSRYSKWRLQRADSLPSAIRMKKNGIWNGGEREEFVLSSTMQNIGHGHYRELPEIKIPMDDWLAFFGLWIAEGSASKIRLKTGFQYAVQICHYDNDNMDDKRILES